MMFGAVVCGVAALVAAGVGFTGVLKTFAGVAKAAFFGLLAAAGVLTALGLMAAKKLGS